MKVSSIGVTNTAFRGHADMDRFASKLAKNDKDRELTQLAKDAFSVEIRWSSDYAEISSQDHKKVEKFIGEAKESKNERLAFLLLHDVRSAFAGTDRYSLNVPTQIKEVMVNLARNSKQVKNTDIVDCLVLHKPSSQLNIKA